MKLSQLNAWVNTIALVVTVPTMISALLLLIVMPGGGYGYRGGVGPIDSHLFLGLTRAQWTLIHTYTGLILVLLLVAHHILHWRYFRNLRRYVIKEKMPET